MPANTTASSPKKKKGRRARLLVIVLVLALVAGVGYATYWSMSTVRASFPQTTGTIKLDDQVNSALKTGEVRTVRAVFKVPKGAKNVAITLCGVGTFDDVDLQ